MSRARWLGLVLVASASCMEDGPQRSPSRSLDDPGRPSGPAQLLNNPVGSSRSEPPSQDGSGCPAGTVPVVKTEGPDLVFVTQSDRCVVALGGNDLITSNATGFTAMLLGSGMDSAQGGLGANLMAGGLGNDGLMGRNGADELYGEGGDDIIDGGGGADRVEGGAGNDSLSGGSGADMLVPGAGRDSVQGG